MTQEKIAAVLVDHALWLRGEGGKRADLSYKNLTRASLDRASLDGVILDGAILDRASLDGANLNRASLDGAILDGASLDGAILNGAILDGGKTAVGILRRALRSDGFEFFLWHCQEGFYLKAGCRFLDMDAARQHWKATRAGTPLGDETQDILDFFDVAITRTEKEA